MEIKQKICFDRRFGRVGNYGVDTKRQTTKQRTYKTAKSQISEKQNGEQQ